MSNDILIFERMTSTPHPLHSPDSPSLPLQSTTSLSLVSLNTYLIPSMFVSPSFHTCVNQSQRAEAMAEFTKQFDVICLQEVWTYSFSKYPLCDNIMLRCGGNTSKICRMRSLILTKFKKNVEVLGFLVLFNFIFLFFSIFFFIFFSSSLPFIILHYSSFSQFLIFSFSHFLIFSPFSSSGPAINFHFLITLRSFWKSNRLIEFISLS
jgi:mRNA deadenylase 3'-5' endonuclease subunit Ccr4